MTVLNNQLRILTLMEDMNEIGLNGQKAKLSYLVSSLLPVRALITSPRAESDRLMAFPSSSLLPHALVFNTRSLPPRSTNHNLFVSRRLSAASKQLVESNHPCNDLLEWREVSVQQLVCLYSSYQSIFKVTKT
ncbi:hypothetical protein NC653_000149 [Populus alba x Populus x berolinensis]|uniref:Uncharacterized protein n=1 Tax=Populus alba x Populus x berolinensis TaxID=444605 RepID=A0AAD6RJ43_9ROSI|nr:hypothetical protein NC653_000149 [Populus alba x Populus x berolinensis]